MAAGAVRTRERAPGLPGGHARFRACVLGIGNTLMGDDGFGVRVAERLRQELRGDASVRVVPAGLAGMGLIGDVLAADTVVFVDALDAGATPGAIFRFDPDEAGITHTRSMTSHGLGIPYLITSARLLGHSPRFVVYAAQVESIDPMAETLSPAVEGAVEKVIKLVCEDLGARHDEHLETTPEASAGRDHAAGSASS